MQAGTIAVGARGARDEVDQPHERLVDEALEHVDVGRSQLRVDVARVRLGCSAGGRRVEMFGSLEQADAGQRARCELIGRLVREDRLVRALGGVVVAALERRGRFDELRGQRRLGRLVGVSTVRPVRPPPRSSRRVAR